MKLNDLLLEGRKNMGKLSIEVEKLAMEIAR